MRKRILVLLIAILSAGLSDQGRAMASGEEAAPPAALLGSWELVTLQAAGQPAEETTGAGLTIAFAADGRVSGSGGCNQFSGTFTVATEGQLAFLPLAATARACLQSGVAEREARYFATLREVGGYLLDGTTGLRLTFEHQGMQLAYRRATPGIPATGKGGTAAPAQVTGTVTHRQRILLPPSAVVLVQLVDVSRQGAPAIVLAEQSITTGGAAPPYPFTLPYDTAQIAARNTYAVQARITVDGQLRFISRQAYLVITQGHPTSDIEVIVDAAGGGTPNLPSTGGGGMAGRGSRGGGWLLLGISGSLLVAMQPWLIRRGRNTPVRG